jgi:hypothetical protein
MLRSFLIFSAIAIGAAPAAAATYSAKPVAPTAERFVTRDIVWACGAGACQGSSNESRPAVLCQALAKRAGRIEAFEVDGRAFSAAELERCNASAKPQPDQAVARAQ